MKYRWLDGFEFEAASAREACERLWASKFEPEDTLQEWMIGMAKRAKMWNGADIRLDSVENMVDDLITNGFMAPVAD